MTHYLIREAGGRKCWCIPKPRTNETTTNRTGCYFVPEPESSSSSNETEDFASASEGFEQEQDPLASSFYSEELSPFEPRPNPFQSFLTSLLQFNSSQSKPNKMASLSNQNPATNGASLKEARMMMPREFSGKRTDLNRFIMSCMAHLTINKEIYQTDEKKIGFMLSRSSMKEKQEHGKNNLSRRCSTKQSQAGLQK